uniref:Uncharacterized protein n=1 Tax=Oryza brachyantha TaxID=4533 RepID=J3LG33_ORYBR
MSRLCHQSSVITAGHLSSGCAHARHPRPEEKDMHLYPVSTHPRLHRSTSRSTHGMERAACGCERASSMCRNRVFSGVWANLPLEPALDHTTATAACSTAPIQQSLHARPRDFSNTSLPIRLHSLGFPLCSRASWASRGQPTRRARSHRASARAACSLRARSLARLKKNWSRKKRPCPSPMQAPVCLA